MRLLWVALGWLALSACAPDWDKLEGGAAGAAGNAAAAPGGNGGLRAAGGTGR